MLRPTTALVLLIGTTSLSLPSGPSTAAEVVEPAPVTILARAKVGTYVHVTTPDGTVVAVWKRTQDEQTKIVAAVRPQGGEWQRPELLAAWSPADLSDALGEPRVVTGRNDSVVALWVSPARRVVRTRWHAGSSWGSPRPLSGEREVAQGVRAVSNDLGQIAVTWQRRTASRGILVRSAVQRGSGWSLATVGKQGPGGLGARPAIVGIDDAGNASAAWYRLRPKPPHSGDGLEKAQNLSLVSRLGSGTTRWEAPHALVGEWEPYFPSYDHTSLVVEDDGTAWIGDWVGPWNSAQPGPMWTREDDAAWVADDRAPYADRFVTNGVGELLSWADVGELVNTRQDDGTWASAEIGASAVVLNDAGDAAIIRVDETKW